ncbi:MAG: helix-turn-helix transcriptional regulator [Ruminococcus sp.]|nr:helix-turn-helix transcriptional regulator [Ruminococcus sp.]
MIGDKIKERRLELELTQLQLSELTCIKKNTISNYENSVSFPSEENIKKIMCALECDANYLFETSKTNEPDISSAERVLIKKYRNLDEYGKRLVSEAVDIEHERCQAQKKLPTFIFRKLSENKASAGFGFNLNNPDEWREIEVVDTNEARRADFAVEVDGDSMEPTLHSGDIVYIVIEKNIPVGQLGLFIQNNNGYIKEAGSDCLISHNKKYSNIYPQSGNIECIGKVIGIASFPEHSASE